MFTSMTTTIISALHLLAYAGECAEAPYYEGDDQSEVTGYIVIDNCALPTTHAMDADRVLAKYLELSGEAE